MLELKEQKEFLRIIALEINKFELMLLEESYIVKIPKEIKVLGTYLTLLSDIIPNNEEMYSIATSKICRYFGTTEFNGDYEYYIRKIADNYKPTEIMIKCCEELAELKAIIYKIIHNKYDLNDLKEKSEITHYHLLEEMTDSLICLGQLKIKLGCI